MIYLVYVEWPSTKGNHAGMAYLANELQKRNSNVKSIKIPVLSFKGGRTLILFVYIYIIIKLLIGLRVNDKLFLMEYLEPIYSRQSLFARIIRFFKPDIPIIGLAHLSGSHLLEYYKNTETIKKQLNFIDHVVVFGSSLKQFFVSIGYNKDKITTIFHYVENDFYKPLEKSFQNNRLRVLFLGSLKRDFDLLYSIISNIDSVDFDILMGQNVLHEKFCNFKNVKLYPFIDENELLNIMQNADISLSVMTDTIGSNVIVSSMSVGLALVVTDTGSIRDYVDETNAILCKENNDYLNAIKILSLDRPRLLSMKSKSWEKAQNMSITNFNKWFNDFFKDKI